MIVTKTARRRLRNYTRYLDYTLDIYRNALEYVNNIVYAEWVNIEQLPLSKQRVSFVERLIHSTSKNKAIYEDFDRLFYKFPSYFRRAVIMAAIGNVSSHMTRYRQWEECNRNRVSQCKKPKGKAPTFQAKCNAFPVFYRDGMSRWIRNGRVALKLYNGSDWIWFILPFEPVDTARFVGWVRQNHLLVKKNNRWSLHIPFKKNIELQDKDFVRPILSVDLGLNHTATCSVVSANGTVLHREFIDYAREKDRFRKLPGQVANSARETWLIPEGQEFARRYWRIVTALNWHRNTHKKNHKNSCVSIYNILFIKCNLISNFFEKIINKNHRKRKKPQEKPQEYPQEFLCFTLPDEYGSVPDSRDLVPDSRDLVPDSRDLVPDSRDLVPDSRDLVPDSRGRFLQVAVFYGKFL